MPRSLISGLLAALGILAVTSGTALAVLRGHEDGVASVAVTPDGNRVVSFSGDRTVRVWDAKSGACLEVIRGNGDLNAILGGAAQFPFRALEREGETAIENGTSGLEVAWFSEGIGHLKTLPSGRAWVGSGMHVYFITLEGYA